MTRRLRDWLVASAEDGSDLVDCQAWSGHDVGDGRVRASWPAPDLVPHSSTKQVRVGFLVPRQWLPVATSPSSGAGETGFTSQWTQQTPQTRCSSRVHEVFKPWLVSFSGRVTLRQDRFREYPLRQMVGGQAHLDRRRQGQSYSGRVPDDRPAWVEPLCAIATIWRASGKSIHQNFQNAAPELADLPRLRFLIGEYLALHRELVDAWQGYSEDKRTSSGPYLDRKKVGYFDGEHLLDVRQYHDLARACADFICREAVSVLEQRRPTPPERGASWPA